MRRETEERTVLLARHMLKTGDTVRETARKFGMSKSAVHKLIRGPLKEISPLLYRQVGLLLGYHKAVKHLRGGQATKLKYESLRRQKNAC